MKNNLGKSLEKNIIDHDSCTLCEICADECVRRVLKVVDDKVEMFRDRCIQCGHCKALCPENAIELRGLDQSEFVPVSTLGDLPTPKQLMDLFRVRRSMRYFKQKPVEEEKVKQIVEAGRLAPTGANVQPVQFNVVNSIASMEHICQEALDALSEQCTFLEQMMLDKEKKEGTLTPIDTNYLETAREWIKGGIRNLPGEDRLLYNAPTLFCLHADPAESPIADIDASIVSAHMILMAEALGLGTCYIGYMPRICEASPEIRKLLKIPAENQFKIAFVAGYPDAKFETLVARNPARLTMV